MILKKCRFIITQDEEKRILENVDLKINEEEHIIEEIGAEVTRESSEEIMDCSKYAVIPGIINPHIHLFTASMRGMNVTSWEDLWYKARNLVEYPSILEESWRKSLNIISSTGTTLIAPTEISYEEFIKQANTFVDIAGGPFVFNMPVKVSGKTIHVSSLSDVKPEMFKEVVDEAHKENINVSIHVSNTRDEVFEFKKVYGKFPVEYLDHIGALRENVILVGLEWITNWELKAIGNAGCKVILIPSCSMYYALGGLPPIIEFMKENTTLGIGSCSLTCNNGFLLQEAKTLLYYIRSSYWSFKVTVQHVFDIMTLGNAAVLNIKNWKIAEGLKVNLTLINIENIKFTPLSKKNIVQNIVMYSEPYDVKYIIIKGKKYTIH